MVPQSAYSATLMRHRADIDDDERHLGLIGVLRPLIMRFAAVPQTVSHDVLRLEFGCRSYGSWMDQRKLEYAFRLQAMAPGRLPRLVSQCAWLPAAGSAEPIRGVVPKSLWLQHEVAAGVAADVGLVVLDHAGDTYAAFKTLAALHVRVRDMRVVTSTVAPGKRTLQRYLRMDAPRPESEAFPTALSPHLDGIPSYVSCTLVAPLNCCSGLASS